MGGISHLLRRRIEIGEGTWRATGAGFEASWHIKASGQSFDLRTEVQGVSSPPAGPPTPEAALAACLLPAMRSRRSIRIPWLASEHLATNLRSLQDKLRVMFPRLRPVHVHCAEIRTDTETLPEQGNGIFLSLGLDSFYSLLMQRRSITDLVLVHGFDIALADEGLWTQSVEAAEEVAAWTDTRVVRVRTNVRELVEEHVSWDEGHGAALAHVGLLLSPWLKRITIASSHHAEPFLPHGSHPELDGLWSTEQQVFVHHGSDVRRIDTLAYVAREKVAMDHLRVCRIRPDGAYNCGRCARCLLAMLGLEVVDGLAQCKTLPSEIPDAALHGVESWTRSERIELEELRDAWCDLRPGSQILEDLRAVVAQALEAES